MIQIRKMSSDIATIEAILEWSDPCDRFYNLSKRFHWCACYGRTAPLVCTSTACPTLTFDRAEPKRWLNDAPRSLSANTDDSD